MTVLTIALAALLAIALATAMEGRVELAAPLTLVVLGIGVSLLPWVPDVEVEPDVILLGVLPPLLYAAAVETPPMELRRELSVVSGLAVVLVVVSSVLLGLLFVALIPNLGLAAGIALGAIVSPTDAVAVAIVRKVGVPERVLTVLQGESLLNDATALVVLRTAVAALATTVSFWGVLGRFTYVVAVAVVVGFVVGKLSLVVRARVSDARVNTLLSFAAPFAASVPAERLDASGLVAAVVAGLVVGYGAPRRLPPRHRASDRETWAVVSLLLEGAVFLVMGLELSAILADVDEEHLGVASGVGIAALALAVAIAIRASYLMPLLAGVRRKARRAEAMKPWMADLQTKLDGGADTERPPGGRALTEQQQARLQTRVRRKIADIDYFLAEPLGWRDGLIVSWAGMRGVVTVAAAQTLPRDTPSRPLLVLIAFVVAAASLLVQGGTLSSVASTLRAAPVAGSDTAERAQVLALMRDAAEVAVERHGPGRTQEMYRRVRRLSDEATLEQTGDVRRLRLAIIAAQREVLLDARDDGTFRSSVLDAALANLDAEQLTIELQGAPPPER